MSRPVDENENREPLSLERYFAYLNDWLVDSTQPKPIYNFLSPILFFKSDEDVRLFLNRLVGTEDRSAEYGQAFRLYKGIFTVICPALYEAKQKQGLWRYVRGEARKSVLYELARQYIRQYVPEFEGRLEDEQIVHYIDQLYCYLLDLYKRVYGDEEHRLLVEKCQSTEDARRFLSFGIEDGIGRIMTQIAENFLKIEFNALPEKVLATKGWRERNCVSLMLMFVQTYETGDLLRYVENIIVVLIELKESSRLEAIAADDAQNLYHVIARLHLSTACGEVTQDNLARMKNVMDIFQEILQEEFLDSGPIFNEGVGKFIQEAKGKFEFCQLPLGSQLEGQLELDITSQMRLFWSQVYGVTAHILAKLEVLELEVPKREVNVFEMGSLKETIRLALKGINSNYKVTRQLNFLVTQNMHWVSRNSPSPLRNGNGNRNSMKQSPPKNGNGLKQGLPKRPNALDRSLSKTKVRQSLTNLFSTLSPPKKGKNQRRREDEFVQYHSSSSSGGSDDEHSHSL